MRIRPFEYLPAASLAEAAAALALAGPEAKALAGGTDLVLAMKKGLALPRMVIGLAGIKGLDSVNLDNGSLRIGALARHADLAVDPLLRAHAPALARAVGLIGSWQIRSAATLGGNLGHASPAADSAPPLLALDAEIITVSPDGGRTIPLARLFTGPGQTCLKAAELIEEILVPVTSAPRAARYLKLMRKKAVDLALIGTAVVLDTDADRRMVTGAAIALGGAAPTPVRAREAEEMLKGRPLAGVENLAGQVARAAAAATRPISDVRASAAYRLEMIKVFVQRGLETAAEELGGGGEA